MRNPLDNPSDNDLRKLYAVALLICQIEDHQGVSDVRCGMGWDQITILWFGLWESARWRAQEAGR